jgi:hypothetical protein
MKKVFSFFLLLLLLLNVMGYYGVFLGMKYRNTLEIMQRLDATAYNNPEAITLKLPLSIPYYGSTEFERVDGEIEHHGEFYRLVKQKFENDTLYVVCIRDIQQKRIHQALAQYVESFSEQSSANNVTTVPSFIKDYVPSSFSLGITSGGWSLSIAYRTAENPTFSTYLSTIYPPPEA